MRNFDFGDDDGHVSPCIPKLLSRRNVSPFLVPAPSPSVLNMYGFKIDVKITGSSKGANGMKRIVGKSFINPPEDFPTIRRYLEKDSIINGDKYGGMSNSEQEVLRKKYGFTGMKKRK